MPLFAAVLLQDLIVFFPLMTRDRYPLVRGYPDVKSPRSKVMLSKDTALSLILLPVLVLAQLHLPSSSNPDCRCLLRLWLGRDWGALSTCVSFSSQAFLLPSHQLASLTVSVLRSEHRNLRPTSTITIFYLFYSSHLSLGASFWLLIFSFATFIILFWTVHFQSTGKGKQNKRVARKHL